MVGTEYHHYLLAGHTHTSTHTRNFLIFAPMQVEPGLKNCSACKTRHKAPYGQYCTNVGLDYCSVCVSRHEPPVGPDCKAGQRAGLFISQGVPVSDQAAAMSRDRPISDRFKDRTDPDYLSYLEDQVEGSKEAKQQSTDISFIVQRLEALELAQQQRHAPIRQQGLLGAQGQEAGLHAAGGTGSIYIYIYVYICIYIFFFI